MQLGVPFILLLVEQVYEHGVRVVFLSDDCTKTDAYSSPVSIEHVLLCIACSSFRRLVERDRLQSDHISCHLICIYFWCSNGGSFRDDASIAANVTSKSDAQNPRSHASVRTTVAIKVSNVHHVFERND